MSERFNHNAETLEEASKYLIRRGKQLLMDGWKISSTSKIICDKEKDPIGLIATFVPNELHRLGTMEAVTNKMTHAYSVYILSQYRGKNYYSDFVKNLDGPIITSPACEIISYLESKKIDHIVRGKYNERYCYKMIERIYSVKKANRSNIEYMNHIDEGLAILTHKFGWINFKKGICVFDNSTLDAFCLHPILQENKLFTKLNMVGLIMISGKTTAMAAEYRNVANAYLSKHGVRNSLDIALSPIAEVNHMLIADKIQNRKDFEANFDKYPNAEILNDYFKAWLARLGVLESEYQEMIRILS